MKNRMTKVQRLALVTVSQPLTSAPTAGLEMMMGWLPLDLHAQQLGMNSYLRLEKALPHTWDCVGSQNRVKGHRKIWLRHAQNIIPHGYPRERVSYDHIWSNLVEDDLECRLHIYMDASKSGANVGYG